MSNQERNANNSEIGKRLKQYRIEKNLTLEQIEESTKIQKKFLVDIENGEFDKLPGQFYGKAFLRKYSSIIGQDPDEIIELVYPQNKPSNHEDDSTEQSKNENNSNEVNKDSDFIDDASRSIEQNKAILNNKRDSDIKENNTLNGNKGTKKTKSKKIFRSIIIYLLLLIFTVLIAFSAYSFFNSLNEGRDKKEIIETKNNDKKDKEKEAKKEESDDNVNGEPEVTISGTVATISIPDKKEFDVTIQALETTWIVATLDGVSVFSGTMTSGSSQIVNFPPNAQSLMVHGGNWPGTAVKIGDRIYQFNQLNNGSRVDDVIINRGV